MDVVLVRWPEESTRLTELRALGAPRLLLVAPEADPPPVVDPLEDWIRMPSDDRDVRTRVATLSARSGTGGATPVVDGEGLLRYRGTWVALSPVECRLATALVNRFGAVVGRDALAKQAWPDGAPTRNALDVHMLRLRRRVSDLGVEIRTVRARGYVMQAAGS